MLCSVPPKNGEDVVLANHGCDLAQNSQLEWVGYLSTTGVYGDCGGEWVDESSQLNTVNERGRHRIKAEKVVAAAEKFWRSCAYFSSCWNLRAWP